MRGALGENPIQDNALDEQARRLWHKWNDFNQSCSLLQQRLDSMESRFVKQVGASSIGSDAKLRKPSTEATLSSADPVLEENQRRVSQLLTTVEALKARLGTVESKMSTSPQTSAPPGRTLQVETQQQSNERLEELVTMAQHFTTRLDILEAHVRGSSPERLPGKEDAMDRSDSTIVDSVAPTPRPCDAPSLRGQSAFQSLEPGAPASTGSRRSVTIALQNQQSERGDATPSPLSVVSPGESLVAPRPSRRDSLSSEHEPIHEPIQRRPTLTCTSKLLALSEKGHDSFVEELPDVVTTIHELVEFTAIPFNVLANFGKIPRSDDDLAVAVSTMDRNTKVVFISHRWLRPWLTQEDCEKNKHVWAGMPHPDDHVGTKYELIVNGVREFAKLLEIPMDEIAVWVDYACIDQDDIPKKLAGIESLLGYMSRCVCAIIPCVESPEFPTVHRMPGEYKARAWTRLEAFGFYALALLRKIEPPMIFYSAPGGKVERLVYIFLPFALPSSGVLFSENDRAIIKQHQEAIIDALTEKALASDCSEAQVGPTMVLASARGDSSTLKTLLDMKSSVDALGGAGITPMWSAARSNNLEIINLLLERNASIDLSPESGLMPIHAAAQQGHLAVVQTLIDAKAHINEGDKQGRSPLDWARREKRNEVENLLLSLGAEDAIVRSKTTSNANTFS